MMHRFIGVLITTGVLVAACGLAPAEAGGEPNEISATPSQASGPSALSAGRERALLVTHSAFGGVPVRSWKSLRDERVVKQDLDHSCGAASIATLLNSFYGRDVTEAQILEALDKGDGRASFEDMARALPQFGFRAQGFAASFEQLSLLRMPVIVYVQHRKDDHFSVLRGISGNTVWLADPSLGNRTYSREQFLKMWQTREDRANTGLSGKFLAVLPGREDIRAQPDFFTRTPHRQSANATAQLVFRVLP